MFGRYAHLPHGMNDLWHEFYIWKEELDRRQRPPKLSLDIAMQKFLGNHAVFEKHRGLADAIYSSIHFGEGLNPYGAAFFQYYVLDYLADNLTLPNLGIPMLLRPRLHDDMSRPKTTMELHMVVYGRDDGLPARILSQNSARSILQDFHAEAECNGFGRCLDYLRDWLRKMLWHELDECLLWEGKMRWDPHAGEVSVKKKTLSIEQ